MSHVTRTLSRAGALLVSAAVLFAGAVVPLAAPAGASTTTPTLSTFDARLLADINHARTIRGIRALTLVAGTTDVAHGWSCHMAAGSLLSHDLRLGALLETHGSSLWTTYGENVGMVSSTSGADALFRAYMNSPGHRANILDRTFRYVGVWTKRANGYRWNTIDFVGSALSSYHYSYGPTRRTC
jgi:uncharacterized protein YkwD